jgi:pimeloyl-ACP methyl ester carboxylesterase
MAYFNILADLHMNYTMNRPLADGAETARIAESKALAPKIKDIETWTSAFLEAAQTAEREKRWLDAAAYYHQVEFFLPAGEKRNGYYDDFARTHALGMEGVKNYERIKVPYPGGNLPGFRLQAKGKQIGTFVFNGGYDSFVEEFYPFLKPLTELGFTVIGFDGPGQGGALRQGIFFEHAWEKVAKAVLDYFKVDEAVWLGASCGGYLALRAAAFEPRIKQVISMPASYWGVDMTLKQIPPGQDNRLLSLFKGGDRKGVDALVAQYRNSTVCFYWCITQGMHITGTKTPFDCLTALSLHSLDGILQNVKQDVLVTEGEDDHLFHVDCLYRIMSELVCARSVTARVFTAREGGEQHCQVGNSALAREGIVHWLARLIPGLEVSTPQNVMSAVA